jgi:hypothetical protein
MIKKLTSLLAMGLFVLSLANAQIQTPSSSPAASFSQDVGLTTISAEYSSPGVKGRTIFAADGLVPFGKVWRTGANAATKITFSDDVKIEGQELKGGSYAVLTIPNADAWKVHFYPYESSNFGSYVEQEPAAIVSVSPVALPFSVHNFMIMVNGISATHDAAVLQIVWDNVLVPMNVSVNTDAKVMASIERAMSGPSTNDYFSAASYMHETGKDLEKALKYVQKATHGDNPMFWQVRREALILADLGRKDEAIAAAKKSLELAQKAGNQDYIRMNEKSIEEWSM